MSSSVVPDFRAASLDPKLGPLASLPGNWSGHGFNLIARPDRTAEDDFFLELNPTDENLRFSAIGRPIPNRGSVTDDTELHGVHYLQRIVDRASGEPIHLEPGVWLSVPATAQPEQPETVVRMASLPHGSALLAQGTSTLLDTPPVIGPANTVPFPIGSAEPSPGTPNNLPEYNLGTPSNFRTQPAPDAGQAVVTVDVNQAAVTDPNSLLTAEITGQTITATTVLHVSTAVDPANHTLGGVESIPFIQANATVAQVSATFWIETVQFPPPRTDRCYLQLQYSQTVYLNFLGRIWPHVSVATLKKVT
jgi:hypothetical protein